MDIDVQNFDASALGFVDDNDYSNLAMMSEEARARIRKMRSQPSRLGFITPEMRKQIQAQRLANQNVVGLGVGVKDLVKVGEVRKRAMLGFKPSPRQQMWINAFRKKNKEVEVLGEKLKVALKVGNKEQKKAYESQIQAILNELKQLKAQNEDLLKKNNADAIPEVVVKEAEVAKTEYDTPTPESATSEPMESVSETTEVETTQPTTKKMNWIIPALGIGVIAYFIFKK